MRFFEEGGLLSRRRLLGTRTMLVSAAKNKKILRAQRAEREARARKAAQSNPDIHIFLSLLQHSSYVSSTISRLGVHKYYIKADEKDNEVVAGEFCYWIDREAIDRSIRPEEGFRRETTRIPDH